MAPSSHLAQVPRSGSTPVLTRCVGWCAACIAAAPLLTSTLVAQGAPSVLELPSSARAAGLGNAYSVAEPLADVLFVHPGRLGDARGFSLFLADLGANARGFAGAGATEWWGGGVAGGVEVLSYTTASTDPADLPTPEAGLGQGGPIPVSEAVLSAGFGRELLGVDVGAVLKLNEMRLGSARSSSVAADLGAAHSLGPVTLALSVQNLGGTLSFPGGERSLPVRVGLGASTSRRPIGPLDLGAAAALNRLGSGDLAGGGGVEVSYWPISGRTFTGRVGYRYDPDVDVRGPTVGGGFQGDQIRLDYAWQTVSGGSAQHRFGIAWR